MTGQRRSVTVSAPGKTILMGEHAAVYGRPALVAAVDRRLYAELRETSGDGVRLELPEVFVSETLGWDQVHEYTRAARRRWGDYEREPEPETFRRLRGDDPAHLVKVALGEAAAFLGEDGSPGVGLRLRSEIPIGSGFGSSAAAAAAIIQGYLSLRGASVTTTDLERVCLEIERRQHGSPSGIDTATVIHGGLVWAVRDATGKFSATPVTIDSSTLDRVRVFHTGTPAESTGEVVAAVRARRDADTEAFERLLDRMEAATRELRRRLETPGAAGDALIRPAREFESCLEEVGVVPPRVREIVRRVEAGGGAAKISGAGALSDPGAGSLLVFHPEPQEIDAWRFLDGCERLDLCLGAEGVRVENSK
ncbi:MAG: hypothetical protein GY719_05635 [bacterium]|nr:hypothetical protein [bacterium]